MKLTCVTAVFNAIESGNRERLVKCVESVARLKTEHEHLIYDGASTDGTVGLLRELEVATSGLKVVSEPDTGIYNALNKGIRDAEGEWLYVLGCDDYICNPALMDKMIGELGDDCDALAASVRIEKSNGELLTVFYPRFSEIYNNPSACHQGEIIRTEVARKLGGFDEQYKIAADSDMFLKAHLSCCRFQYRREVFAVLVGVGVSATNTEESQREHRASVANVLGLGGRDRNLLMENRVLPFGMCFRLWNHDDLVIRHASRAMVMQHIRMLVKRYLHPLVVITRPLRYMLKRWTTDNVRMQVICP